MEEEAFMSFVIYTGGTQVLFMLLFLFCRLICYFMYPILKNVLKKLF